MRHTLFCRALSRHNPYFQAQKHVFLKPLCARPYSSTSWLRHTTYATSMDARKLDWVKFQGRNFVSIARKPENPEDPSALEGGPIGVTLTKEAIDVCEVLLL